MLESVVGLAGRYSEANDPWPADTILVSPELANMFTADQLVELEESLERLGLVLVVRPDVPSGRLVADRRDLGPWPDLAVQAEPSA
jgi:hypothetical protein